MSETIQPHILVVDDDAQIRALLEEYLKENGLRASVAPNGSEMSRILADEAIDLVILDLRLAERVVIGDKRKYRGGASLGSQRPRARAANGSEQEPAPLRRNGLSHAKFSSDLNLNDERSTT